VKHHVVCERDPEKPKQSVCIKCARLKEKCKWLEVGGSSPVVDKGKGKVKEQGAAMSLQGSEKWKKKKTAKVVIDDNEIVEVASLSRLRFGLNSR